MSETDAQRLDEIRNTHTYFCMAQDSSESEYAYKLACSIPFLLAQLDAANQTIAELKTNAPLAKYVREINDLQRQVSELTEEHDYYRGALEMFRDDAQRDLDLRTARENGGQSVGNQRYPLSLARDIVRSINWTLSQHAPRQEDAK